MIYIYDHAICEDIRNSFADPYKDSVVKVIEPEGAINIAAQIQNDEVKFPIVVLTRDGNYTIDESRYNFTRAKKGVPAAFDPKENYVYNEKAIPINLSYNMTILTTDTATMDELIKEFIFKYTQMYFLTVELPYEAKRKIRFGVSIDPDANIDQSSGSFQYIESGSLYQSILPLRCEGCVIVSYTGHRMHRFEEDQEIVVENNYYYTPPKLNKYGVVEKIPKRRKS